MLCCVCFISLCSEGKEATCTLVLARLWIRRKCLKQQTLTKTLITSAPPFIFPAKAMVSFFGGEPSGSGGARLSGFPLFAGFCGHWPFSRTGQRKGVLQGAALVSRLFKCLFKTLQAPWILKIILQTFNCKWTVDLTKKAKKCIGEKKNWEGGEGER